LLGKPTFKLAGLEKTGFTQRPQMEVCWERQLLRWHVLKIGFAQRAQSTRRKACWEHLVKTKNMPN